MLQIQCTQCTTYSFTNYIVASTKKGFIGAVLPCTVGRGYSGGTAWTARVDERVIL